MTLPRSLVMNRPGPEAEAVLRGSGNMCLKARRVPIAGSGRREGRAEVSRWESSRRVHDCHVYICTCGGRSEKGLNSSSLLEH